MNQHIDDIPRFDDANDEREWLAQERAMRRERLHLDAAGDDARSRRYRLLARALREPLPDALPPDFAARVAARVASAPASSTRLEFVLTTALAIALAIAAAAVTAMYGSEWLPSFSAILPAPRAPASGWLLAVGGCLGASWLLGEWQRHGRR
jgi:anti-sigma factor RsiW